MPNRSSATHHRRRVRAPPPPRAVRPPSADVEYPTGKSKGGLIAVIVLLVDVAARLAPTSAA